ncbi:MAG: HD domain-containing phosphohydrolase [Syntrophobacteraceae bacterium]
MLKGTFLRSKIGRRIFSLFICCSMLPITILALLSFAQVTRNLEEQGHRRLYQSTKSLAVSMVEVLLFLDDELRRTGAEYLLTGSYKQPRYEMGYDKPVPGQFKSICVFNEDSLPVVLLGREDQPTPSPEILINRPLAGKTALVTISSELSQARIFLVRPLESSGSGILVAEIDPGYLWRAGVEHFIPAMSGVCVVDQSRGIVVSSILNANSLLSALDTNRKNGRRDFEWDDEGETHIADSYSLFLKSRFDAENWLVIMSQAKSDLFAPLSDFKAIFPSVVFLSVLVVAFLSLYYIRLILVPLERIKEGIKQIHERDFNARIVVQSKDEFHELAATFNDMSAHLGKQFQTLTTISAIDRAILSSLDTDSIVSTVLTSIRGFLSCDRICISLADPQHGRGINYYPSESEVGQTSEPVKFSSAEIMQILSSRESLIISAGADIPGYLAPINKPQIRFFLVLPVFVKNRLAATLNLGFTKLDVPPDDDLLHARQLADQMAVALSNSSLVEELNELNWGTLKALARTVDAKSSWTAGHSERVFELAMSIAGALNFTHTELSVLHRGALLHDIGKVGIPSRILDKPSKLTSEEYDLIKTHPQIGAGILEPIAAYKEAIPMVLQHHEKFDGTGYPLGLSGERIHIGARILAVADVFDAMVADRPYRNGLDLNEVLKYIRQGKGNHFDPEVVEAFFSVISIQESVLTIFGLSTSNLALK